MSEELGEFEGDRIVAMEVAVKGVGDGLSKALKIEPVKMRRGDKVYVVVETEVGEVGFAPVKGVNGVVKRTHDLHASVATIVDRDLVAEVLAAQQAKNEAEEERVKREKEAAKGIQRLPGTTGDPDPDTGEGSGDDEWDDGGEGVDKVKSIAERTGRRPGPRGGAQREPAPDPGVEAAQAAKAAKGGSE